MSKKEMPPMPNILLEMLLMIIAALILCLVFSWATGCSFIGPPVGPPDSDPGDCAAACKNLAMQGCPGWRGSPGQDERWGTQDDVSCIDVCLTLLQEPTATLYPKCTAQAKTCAEVELCFELGGE